MHIEFQRTKRSAYVPDMDYFNNGSMMLRSPTDYEIFPASNTLVETFLKVKTNPGYFLIFQPNLMKPDLNGITYHNLSADSSVFTSNNEFPLNFYIYNGNTISVNICTCCMGASPHNKYKLLMN